MQFVGKVLWWNDRDGFGVIEDAAGNEYYFDTSSTISPTHQSIKRNQVVTFEVNSRIKDCLCASKVKIPAAADRRKIATKFDKEAAKVTAA
jgi:cold shock CspA family protein